MEKAIIGGVVLIVLIFVFAPLFPGVREERRYKAELSERKPVTDEELFRQYFDAGDVAPDVPGRVREVFAKHMGYSPEKMAKMLPDDDLSFYWNEVDAIDQVRDLEQAFNITITKAEFERTRCTIRSVSLLVEHCRQGRTMNHV
jgi:hypothetical protein